MFGGGGRGGGGAGVYEVDLLHRRHGVLLIVIHDNVHHALHQPLVVRPLDLVIRRAVENVQCQAADLILGVVQQLDRADAAKQLQKVLNLRGRMCPA